MPVLRGNGIRVGGGWRDVVGTLGSLRGRRGVGRGGLCELWWGIEAGRRDDGDDGGGVGAGGTSAGSSSQPSAVGAAGAAGATGSALWPTYHHDAGRSGVDPTAPAAGTVAKAWTSPSLDGTVYAEPLVVGNRVIAATEGDTVYALAAST